MKVTITFLGGLSDIGRNCALLECGDEAMVLDCGVLFPNEEQPGVDNILPDMSYIYERADSIKGCLITHAHEDHIGAVKHLLKEVDCPIYGSEFSLGLVKRRLQESGISGDFREVQSGDVIDIGPFKCELLNVTHSIPGGHITFIHTPHGNILHSSDFKLDENPVDGELTDIARIMEISKDQGFRLLLADSTNSDSAGFSESESSVQKALSEVFSENEGRRIFVACFSSHIHRIQQIINTAEEFGRRIAFMGMSMQSNVDLARNLEVLHLEDYLDIGEINDFADEELCVIVPGSQAEGGSSLATAALGKNRWVKIGSNDTVILSSNPIPGNEARIYRMINALCERGVTVASGSALGLHTSGHGRQGELKVLHQAANAEWFVPVHGELRHLLAHKELAVSLGMAEENVLVAVDGDQVEMNENGLKLNHQVCEGSYIFRQGKILSDSQSAIKERMEMSQDGAVFVSAHIHRHKLQGRVLVDSKGWVDDDLKPELHGEVSKTATKATRNALKARKGEKEIRKLLRKIIRDEAKSRTGRFPAILIHTFVK